MPGMTLTRYSRKRLVAVTLGLSGAGALFGGVAGAVALGVGLALTGSLSLGDIGILLIPGVIGAALGAISAPLAGWLLLRRVPLGRAFGSLTLGTILGGVAGWFLAVSFDTSILPPIVAAGLGFVTAAVILRLKYSRAAQAPTAWVRASIAAEQVASALRASP